VNTYTTRGKCVKITHICGGPATEGQLRIANIQLPTSNPKYGCATEKPDETDLNKRA
jgi:hypothetical protein